jgi:hypothetical protein
MARCNNPKINDGKGIEADSYVIVYFDPHKLSSLMMMHNAHCWNPPAGIEFDVFDINKIDPTVEPLNWEIFDEDGLSQEIMPHCEP